MKQIKRYLALFLAVIIVLTALAACDGNDTEADGVLSGEAETTENNGENNSNSSAEGDGGQTPDGGNGGQTPDGDDGEQIIDDGEICPVKISGISITRYNIVIPSTADLSAAYAAQNLSDFLIEKFDIELDIVKDSTAATDYEILIGDTSREESNVSLAPDASKMEYIFYKDGNKLVCQGDSFMVGGGVGELVSLMSTGENNIRLNSISTQASVKTFEFKKAKSAILMIGDGMGLNHVKRADSLISGGFVADDLPNKGFSVTSSLKTLENGKTDRNATDSAAGGTALSTGYRTYNGYVGIDGSKNTLTNIRELAHSKGYKTGVITTDVITGATPGAFLVHVASRDDTAALQQGVDALIRNNQIDVCEGDVGNNLTAQTASALKTLSADGENFFLMIEEAQIDKKSHEYNINNDSAKWGGVFPMMERFNDDIAYVIQFVLCHPDTMLIITADHETGGLEPSGEGWIWDYGDHTVADVGVYALGYGAEYFNGRTVNNIDIPKFIAKIYGENNFGQQ